MGRLRGGTLRVGWVGRGFVLRSWFGGGSVLGLSSGWVSRWAGGTRGRRCGALVLRGMPLSMRRFAQEIGTAISAYRVKL